MCDVVGSDSIGANYIVHMSDQCRNICMEQLLHNNLRHNCSADIITSFFIANYIWLLFI